MTSVLITGARAPVALHLCRLFHAAGHAVWLADTPRFALSRFTRTIRGYVRLPAPRDNLQAYGEAVANAVARHHIDLVIPTCEEVLYLAAARDRLGVDIPLFAPGIDTLVTAHHKGRFARDAAGLGADPPRTDLVTSRAELTTLGDATERVLKPAWSRFATRVLIQPSREDLSRVTPTPDDPWLVQDFVSGDEICAYAVAREGQLLAFSAYMSTWRAGPGAGIAFRPIENNDAQRFAAGYAQRHNWTGQFSFDFRKDVSGRLHVLECNPRATSGLHFFTAADGLPDSILSGTWSRPGDRRAMTLPLALLCYGLPQALRSGRISDLRRDLREMTNLLAFPGDTTPGLSQLLALGEIAAIALRRRISLQQASTVDIEWNGEPFG